jgi:pseudaminic acid cytidylyltransferase
MALSIIPARGGSKRIPRKNIKDFAGKPMIVYAIEAAQASGAFDHVVVSTDDAEIADVARRHGALVPFMRPPELSDDFTPTVPVIAHAIRACDAVGISAQHVCCIYPGVPLIDPADLSRARDLLDPSDTHYTFPVAPYPAPIQRALKRDAHGTTRPFNPEYANTRTQDLEPGYYDAGQFYWGLRDAWIDGLNIHRNGKTIVLPEWRVVDIDTLDDWFRAELLFNATRHVSDP